MLLRKNGNQYITKTQENLEYKPLASLLAQDKSKTIDYGVELFIARTVGSTINEVYVSGKNEPVSVKETLKTSKWEIVTEKEINAYLDGKALEEFKVPSIANKQYSHVLTLCIDEEIQNAELKNMVTFYNDNKEVAPYVNLNTEENIASGKPLRLVEQYYYDLDHVLRTTKDKYICRPYFITASNRNFDLKSLVSTLSEKPKDNWIFNAIKDGYRESYIIEGRPTEEQIKDIIQTVPYYNQSESYTLYEVKGYYIPKVDEIKKIISQEKYGFKWCQEFYKGELPQKDLDKISLYEKDNIFAYCLDGYNSSKEYTKYIKSNSKKIEKERRKSLAQPE